MKNKADNERNTFSLRVPAAVNEKLAERANSIGVSKSAVILNMLYEEFIERKKHTPTGATG